MFPPLPVERIDKLSGAVQTDYGVAGPRNFEFQEVLENSLIFSLPDRCWQLEICNFLGIKFHQFVLPYPWQSKQISRNDPPSQTENIISEGNCFFRSVSFLVCGSETEHERLRKLICDLIALNHSHLSIQSNYLQTSRMQENSTWAGDVEIFACAALLQCAIHVYSSHASVGSVGRWLSFVPNRNISSPCIPQPVSSLYLDHKNENHFQSVMSI